MCRWFTYISPTEPCLLSDVLISSKHSITHQVNEHYLPRLFAHLPTATEQQQINARNSLLNVDGLGVAWYTTSFSDFELGDTGASDDGRQLSGLHPAAYKTIQPPAGDSNFKSICRNTETRCCFAHIRATSATAVAQVNNHPFIFGRLAFMHNGVVSDFVSIKRQICNLLDQDTFANINGSTDSEHMAALFVHFLTEQNPGSQAWEENYSTDQMEAALHSTVKTIIELQQKALGTSAKPNSLNLAVTDGSKMVAYRFRNHATEQPPSLYYSTRAGITLNRKYPDHPDGGQEPVHAEGTSRKATEDHGRHVIVASEPSTYIDDDWNLIGRNQAVLVGADGRMEIREIGYEKQWDAIDVI